MRYLDLLAEAPVAVDAAAWEDAGFWPGDAPRARQFRSMLSALAAEVSQTSPAGIGTWPPLGDLVDPPIDRLSDIGTEYVEGRADREDVLRAVREVRHSWWEAASLYRATKRSITCHGSERAA